MNLGHAFSGADGYWQTTSPTLSAGEWYHYVVTYDGSSTANDPTLYVNGEVRPINEISAPTGTISSDSGGDIAIASIPGGTLRWFDGSLDDVRIYDRELTAEDIAELYRSWEGHLDYNADARTPEYFDGNDWQAMGLVKPTTGGLVGHWKLDEASGNFADSSGYGNDGTDNGGVEYASGGVISYAAGFDSATSKITVAHDDSLTPPGNMMTLAFWMHPNVDWNTLPNDVWSIFDKKVFTNTGWSVGVLGFNSEELSLSVCDGTTCDSAIRFSSGVNDWTPMCGNILQLSSTVIQQKQASMLMGPMSGLKLQGYLL